MNTRTIETPNGEIGIIEYEGREYAAGGGYVDHASGRAIAYPSKGGVLTLWGGKVIGTWRAVASWRTPRSFMGSHMFQIEAVIDGRLYTGRGFGEGMVWFGKIKRSGAKRAFGRDGRGRRA